MHGSLMRGRGALQAEVVRIGGDGAGRIRRLGLRGSTCVTDEGQLGVFMAFHGILADYQIREHLGIPDMGSFETISEKATCPQAGKANMEHQQGPEQA